MSMSQYKKGAAALGALTTEKGGAAPSSEFTKFAAGTTLRVRVKGTEDLMQYFGYGVFKRVNTFVAKSPSVRNDRGYVESNPTPWDMAAQYYYDKAKAAEEAGAGESEVKALRTEGYKYAGKERYAMGFVDLATGEDIIVDLTRDQAKEVYGKITKYAKKLDRVAFELSKTGARQDTKVSLDPLTDLDDDLTPDERKHLDASIGKPFDQTKFDGLLYEMDTKEQTEALVAAGFDITLIGLSIGGTAPEKAEEATKAAPITGEAKDPDLNF
jgi:hypothetical protein